MKANDSNQVESISGLTPTQERAIIALLSYSSMKKVATSVGIGEATLWRWLQDKDFHAAYMNVRRESVRQSIARLQQASSEAVSTLRAIAKDKKAPANARVTAAKAIIEFSMKAVELEDLAERVAQLEAIQSQGNGKR